MQETQNLDQLFQDINNVQSNVKIISERLMSDNSTYEESQALTVIQKQLGTIARTLDSEINRVDNKENSG